jgi:hypothetical protein
LETRARLVKSARDVVWLLSWVSSLGVCSGVNGVSEEAEGGARNDAMRSIISGGISGIKTLYKLVVVFSFSLVGTLNSRESTSDEEWLYENGGSGCSRNTNLLRATGKDDSNPGELIHRARSSPCPSSCPRSRPSTTLGSSKVSSTGSLTKGINDTASSLSRLPFLSYSPSPLSSTLGPRPSGSLMSMLGGEGDRLEYRDPGLGRTLREVCPIPTPAAKFPRGVERVRIRIRVRPRSSRFSGEEVKKVDTLRKRRVGTVVSRLGRSDDSWKTGSLRSLLMRGLSPSSLTRRTGWERRVRRSVFIVAHSEDDDKQNGEN